MGDLQQATNRPFQVGKQNAAEAQPLIFEPDSQFYKDPVIVLDFQSLYPSIMIGYNYCYSTCLGRVERFKGVQKLGWEEVRLPPGMLELLQDDITSECFLPRLPFHTANAGLVVSPNGVMFAKQRLRKSLLAKMLGEILDTRVMVKEAMKLAKGDEASVPRGANHTKTDGSSRLFVKSSMPDSSVSS